MTTTGPHPPNAVPPAADERLVTELGELADGLAVAAGRLAYEGSRGDFGISVKSSPTDLVTEVDGAVESWIAAELDRRRPDDTILGEERGTSTRDGRVRWLVDPIDGTVNFALGIPHYAVSIAAEVDGTVVAGCVHNPESGETFSARRGAGAYLTDGTGTRRLTGPRQVSLERAVIATGFGYNAAVRRRQGAVVAALLPRIGDIRRFGAASLDLCSVAAGRIDGYYEAGLNPWDWGAGLLVAAEAGCVASGLRGQPPGARFLAVGGSTGAAALFELLTELGADGVSSSS